MVGMQAVCVKNANRSKNKGDFSVAMCRSGAPW